VGLFGVVPIGRASFLVHIKLFPFIFGRFEDYPYICGIKSIIEQI
jgi:hypothetical protein